MYDIALSKHKYDIEKKYSNVTKNTEVECLLHNYELSLDNYVTLAGYMNVVYRNNKGYKLESTITLDINGSVSSDTKIKNYRITIHGIDYINHIMSELYLKNDRNIYHNLIHYIRDNDTSVVTIMEKSRNKTDVVDIDDLGIRFRFAEEKSVSKDKFNDVLASINKVSFRYKERLSLILSENMRIDLTMVKMTQDYKSIMTATPRYEIEVDLSVSKPDKKYLDQMYKEVERIIKVIQKTNHVITMSKSQDVLEYYKTLLNIGGRNMHKLYGPQVHTLNTEVFNNDLAHNYAVSDKADGDRSFLIIKDKHVYLISNNLFVRNTGIVIKDDKYNGSILDGEYVFLKQYNKFIFLAFDCLRNGDKDIRNHRSLSDRLKQMNEVIRECFGNNLTIKEVDKVDDSDKHYEKELKEFVTKMKEGVKKNELFIVGKPFIYCKGAYEYEIYKNSLVFWKSYMSGDNKIFYNLDGLIFQPMQQIYTTDLRQTEFHNLKWKPNEDNTIDFYIRFEKEDGKIALFYDKTDHGKVTDKYAVCYLYVDNGKPELFKSEEELHICHIHTVNEEVRDKSGNLIQDETVVEFYYVDDRKLSKFDRWIPLRTRYDKTEVVIKHNKVFGNYIKTAENNWGTIMNPITLDDFSKKTKNIKKAEISREMSRSGPYYDQISDSFREMRNFHNFIKSQLINTYCSSEYSYDKKLSIFDIGCGRGGDIPKFINADIDHYFGTDVDYEILYMTKDSANNRYTSMNRRGDLPLFEFAQMDSTVKYDMESQIARFPDMPKNSRDILKKHINSKFDRINCQFTIHYYLENETTWDNFKYNINKLLKPGGYMMITTFDGDIISNLLEGKPDYKITSKDEHNNEIEEFVIKKQYNDDGVMLGKRIDVMNSFISEGRYDSEYLVYPKFLIGEFNKMGLELVESDTFENLYDMYSEFINGDANKMNHVCRISKLLCKIMQYKKTDLGMNITRLNRYYVFRKI